MIGAISAIRIHPIEQHFGSALLAITFGELDRDRAMRLRRSDWQLERKELIWPKSVLCMAIVGAAQPRPQIVKHQLCPPGPRSGPFALAVLE